MMAGEDSRMQILEMIDSGKITAEEGLRLLESLGDEAKPLLEDETGAGLPDTPARDEAGNLGAPASAHGDLAGQAQLNPEPPADTPPLPDMSGLRRLWVIPLWTGVGVTLAGSLLMYLALRTSGVGFWLGCASLPLVLGLVVLVLAWQSRTARWLYLHIEQRSGEYPQEITFGLPVPLRLSGWLLRTFGSRIPGMQGATLDSLLLALEHSTSPEKPFYVEVEDDEDGERVQILIG